MADPSDEGPLRRWLETSLQVHGPSLRVHAVLGKTEGNGCVNDFSRGLASRAVGSIFGGTTTIMSGGTEGVLCPHYTVLATYDDTAEGTLTTAGGGLALGTARTRVFLPEEIGTVAQIEATRDAVVRACQAANLNPLTELAWAQIKCPLVTSQQVKEAKAARGADACDDAYESMAQSRRASAQGVRLAAGETTENFSALASTSAGVELDHSEVLVLGNSPSSASDLKIVQTVMRDALDAPAVFEACERAGLEYSRGQLTPQAQRRVAAVLCKADPAPQIRGHRTTMFTDSDFNATRHSRAAVAGLLSGIFADTRIFVSGGAESQGPPGGGPFAIIYDDRRRDDTTI